MIWVLSAVPLEWQIGLTGFVIFLCPAFWFLYKSKRHKHTHRNMVRLKPTEIGFLQTGPVEVLGRVKSIKKTVPSPWTRKPSVIYNFWVDKYVSGQDGGWCSYVDDWHKTPFLLKDDTGEVTIEAESGDCELKIDRQCESTENELKALLQNRYKKKTKGLLLNKTLRFRESFLEEDDQVYVYGEAKQVNGKWVISAGKEPLIINDEGETLAEEQRSGIGTFHLSLCYMCLACAATFLLSATCNSSQ